MSIQQFWDSIWSAGRVPPATVVLPANHVQGDAQVGTPIKPNADYFQVIVNQLFLEKSRKWFTTIDPLVMAVTNFSYQKLERSVPFLVGPGMLEGALAAAKTKEPAGMIYRNTRVAGVHPYRGGPVSLAIVLCQVPVSDASKRLLGVVDGLSQAIDIATSLTPYLKIGGAVLNGFNSLMGLDGVKALMGWQAGFGDGNTPFTTGYYVLIDGPGVDAATLWVRNGELFQGATEQSATAVRDRDFVLFSIVKPPEGKRTDLDRLAYWLAWERVQGDAGVAKADNWETAKVNMATLLIDLMQSPDLTEGHAQALGDEYIAKMRAIHDKAVGLSHLGAAKSAESAAQAAVRQRALKVLAL